MMLILYNHTRYNLGKFELTYLFLTQILEGRGRDSPYALKTRKIYCVHLNIEKGHMKVNLRCHAHVARSVHRGIVITCTHSTSIRLDSGPKNGDQSFPTRFCRSGWSVVIILATGSEIREFKPGRGRWIFSERKLPEYDFLQKGSKAVGPVS